MTRLDVKVGDKVRVVNPTKTGGYYKKGDVLTVSDRCQWGIAVKESSTPLLHWEYELYEPIKVGDTVTLIDNFYEHEACKAEPRIRRKSIASLDGDVFNITHINLSNRASTTSGIVWSIPIDLLRKVDDGINTGRTQFVHKTDLEPYDGIHRHTPEQVAEAQRIIGEIVAGFRNFECFFIRDDSDRELSIYYTKEVRDGMHTITAHCSPHDEFNRTIGLLVALCKATGRKLPDWI